MAKLPNILKFCCSAHKLSVTVIHLIYRRKFEGLDRLYNVLGFVRTMYPNLVEEGSTNDFQI